MEDVFITRIDIHKVRHLQDLTIELSETERKHLILTGRNGSGKTSLLENIRNCLLTIPLRIKIDPNNDMAGIQLLDVLNTKIITIEFNNAVLSKPDTIFLYIPARRKFDIKTPQSIEKVDIDKEFTIEQEASIDFLKYMLDLDYQKLSAASDGDSIEAKRIDKWFSNFLDMLKDIYECPELELKKIAKDKTFKINMPNREPFGLNEMADGYSALLKIVMELMMRMESKATLTYDMSGIVLIDEIETHLHVELQRKVLPFLTKMFPNIQFIVTTHSPFVISSLENAVVYDLEKQCRLEDMSAYSYDGIVEYYYNSDQYSEAAKANLEEYKKLAAKKDRSEKENEHLAELTLYFDSTPILGSPQIMNAFLETEMNRRNGSHG